jgi:hypothetical protein
MLDYGCPAQLAPHRPAPPAAASPPQVMCAFIQTAAARYRSPGLAGRRSPTFAALLAEVAVLRSIKTPLAISKWIGDDLLLDLKWSLPMYSPEQSRRGRNAGLDDPRKTYATYLNSQCSPEFTGGLFSSRPPLIHP